jgi:hypothetical protein
MGTALGERGDKSDAIVRYTGRPAIWGATVTYRFN